MRANSSDKPPCALLSPCFFFFLFYSREAIVTYRDTCMERADELASGGNSIFRVCACGGVVRFLNDDVRAYLGNLAERCGIMR